MHPGRMPSGLSSLIAGRQQFANSDPAGTPTKLPNAGESFVDLLLTPVYFGHNAGNRAPVPRDDQRFAPLHFVQELGQMNFGLRRLNLAHIINQSIQPVSLYHTFPQPKNEVSAVEQEHASRAEMRSGE